MRKVGLIASMVLVSYVLGLAFARYAVPANSANNPQIEQVSSTNVALDTAISPIEEADEPETAKASPSVQVAADRLAIGDSRLLADDPAGAHKQYKAFLANAPKGTSAPLRYRMALCAEFLGEYDHAMREYERLVSGCSNNRIVIAAQLGQARLWHNTNCSLDARRAVWSLFLTSRAKGDDSTELQAEYVHQLGQLLACRTVEQEQTDLLSDLTIVDPTIQWSLPQALRWVTDDSSEAVNYEGDVAEAEDVKDAPVRLTQQLELRAEESYLEANLPQMPVAAVVELLSRKANLKAEWTPAARDRVAEHTVQVAIPETALAILLDGISDLMELVWQESGGTIRMQTRQEVDREFTRQYDLDVAKHMLRLATTAFPEHELADAAYWALGNTGVRRGQSEVAILQYEQFLRQFSRSEARVGVHFNLAKTKLCMGNRDEAMEHFYHVVDEALADRLQPIAFLYLGRLYLEDDQTERATRSLNRSLALARDDVSRATAAIALASAYLLQDKPHVANRILMTHRSAFGQDPHYGQAALLAALARRQAASTTTQIEKQGRPLLDAVTHLDGADFFGAYGHVILAEAYQRVGLFEAQQVILQRGLEVVPRGGLRSRMQYTLAEYHNDARNMADCRDLLTSLAIDGNDAWADRARLRLAEVEGAEGNDKQCLAICRELLEGTSQTIERQDVLKTMGRVFERQGSHRAAALCFAGTEPGIPSTGQ